MPGVYGEEGDGGPPIGADGGGKAKAMRPGDLVDYHGRRGRNGEWLVNKDWQPLSPKRSQKVRNHSPTGFSWGFGGSGPAQLALALLLDVVGEEEARRHYQAFKWDVVSTWPQDGPWEISADEIRRWVGMQRRRDNGGLEVRAAS